MTAAGISLWLKKVYDKLAAAAVLLVLVISLFMLAVQAQSLKQQQSRFDGELQRQTPLHALAQPTDRTLFDMSRLALIDPSQIGEWPLRLMVPELRVRCTECQRPIPYAATVCSFCKAEQGPDVAPDPFKDWLKKNNLNTLDAEIGSADADNDGFTNREEFDFKTDPNQATNHPPALAKVTVQSIQPISFRLIFKSVSKMPEGKNLFQINLRSNDKTWWKSIGEEVEGFKLITYDEKGPEGQVLTLQRGDKKIPLIKGREVPRNEYLITLNSKLDGGALPPVRVDEEFTVKGVQYRVKTVDISSNTVLIHDPSRDMDVLISGQVSGPKSVPQP